MRKLFVNIFLTLNFIRCFPHLMLYLFHKNRLVIKADARRWLQELNKNHSLPLGFIYLLVFYPQFRNLFYFRIKSKNILLNILCPRMSSLLIGDCCKHIGEGFFLPHGHSTLIGAKYIGKNCSINHNVTIGINGQGNHPIILDNVKINAGAVLFGKITIGNNVIIGANATVNRDIPDNCTVFPTPSRIMRWKKRPSMPDPESENYLDNYTNPII